MALEVMEPDGLQINWHEKEIQGENHMPHRRFEVTKINLFLHVC